MNSTEIDRLLDCLLPRFDRLHAQLDELKTELTDVKKQHSALAQHVDNHINSSNKIVDEIYREIRSTPRQVLAALSVFGATIIVVAWEIVTNLQDLLAWIRGKI